MKLKALSKPISFVLALVFLLSLPIVVQTSNNAVIATISTGQIYEFRNNMSISVQLTIEIGDDTYIDFFIYNSNGTQRRRERGTGRGDGFLPAGAMLVIEHRAGGNVTVSGVAGDDVQVRRLQTPVFHVRRISAGVTQVFNNYSSSHHSIDWWGNQRLSHSYPLGSSMGLMRAYRTDANGTTNAIAAHNLTGGAAGVPAGGSLRITGNGGIWQREIFGTHTAFSGQPYRLTIDGQRSYPPGTTPTTPPEQTPSPQQPLPERYYFSIPRVLGDNSTVELSFDRNPLGSSFLPGGWPGFEEYSIIITEGTTLTIRANNPIVQSNDWETLFFPEPGVGVDDAPWLQLSRLFAFGSRRWTPINAYTVQYTFDSVGVYNLGKDMLYSITVVHAPAGTQQPTQLPQQPLPSWYSAWDIQGYEFYFDRTPISSTGTNHGDTHTVEVGTTMFAVITNPGMVGFDMWSWSITYTNWRPTDIKWIDSDSNNQNYIARIVFNAPGNFIIDGGFHGFFYVNVVGSVVSAPNINTASYWARDGINAAISIGLIPVQLQNHYTNNINRAEFAALAVNLYETITNREITGRVSFADTTDVNVQKAAYIGIVSGTGNNNFSPYMQFNREQAAVILSRLAYAVGQPLPQVASTFADNAQISPWAFQSVGQVQAAGIMGGVGDNTFAPFGTFTREQSIVTILRMFDILG